MSWKLKLIYSSFLFAAGVVLWLPLGTQQARAIPAFARKHHTSCQNWHSNWLGLNDFGLALKMNGFKFPSDDDQFVKKPPLMLGANNFIGHYLHVPQNDLNVRFGPFEIDLSNITLVTQYSFGYQQLIPGTNNHFYRDNTFLSGIEFVY